MAKEKIEKPKKGNNKLMLVIIFMLILIILFGGTVMFVLLKNKNIDVSKNLNINTITKTQTNVSDKVFSFKDEFLLNLNDEKQKRYIKANIGLGYNSNNKNLDTEITGKEVILRDKIINVLRSKKATDFSNEDSIKKEILDKVNSVLDNGRIENIYFTNLIIQ